MMDDLDYTTDKISMNASTLDDSALGALVDDRIADGIFRVRRQAFLDPRVFDLEMSHVFEGTWIFLGLDSEVERPHDYVTRRIGRQPVILMRDATGNLGCFFNSCRHRSTVLCPFSKGSQKLHVCRYHGWTYDSTGRNVGITAFDEGQYPPAFKGEDHDLIRVPHLASYRGFVFASLAENVPSLLTHLGEARVMLDLVADQAPDGLEYVPGPISYTFDGNWKLQFENGLDAYHFPSTHAAFVNIIKQRRPPDRTPAGARNVAGDAGVASGTISFPRGHAVSWSIGIPGQAPESRPLARDPALMETVRQQVGDPRLDWMLRQRNLTIFPNMQLIDIQSLQLRTWEPLAVDKTRMISHCLAPKGESAEARRFRIRQYEEFFNASGLATSDDNVMYELNQSGFAATALQSYSRGIAAEPAAAAHFAALGLQDARCTYSTAGLRFGDETAIHSGYREWHRLLRAE